MPEFSSNACTAPSEREAVPLRGSATKCHDSRRLKVTTTGFDEQARSDAAVVGIDVVDRCLHGRLDLIGDRLDGKGVQRSVDDRSVRSFAPVKRVTTAASRQLDRSRAKRRVTVLMSDCRATTGGDALPIARRLDELCIIAPTDDSDDAAEFARKVGATLATVDGPSDIPGAILQVLER